MLWESSDVIAVTSRAGHTGETATGCALEKACQNQQSGQKMPDRCVVGGCSNIGLKGEIAVFFWPIKNESLSRKWASFLRTTRKDVVQPSKHTCVCHHHFDDSQIEGWIRFKYGGGRLKLKEGASRTYHKEQTSCRWVIFFCNFHTRKKRRKKNCVRIREGGGVSTGWILFRHHNNQ